MNAHLKMNDYFSMRLVNIVINLKPKCRVSSEDYKKSSINPKLFPQRKQQINIYAN